MLIVAGTSVLVMLCISFKRHHYLTAALSLAGLLSAYFSIPCTPDIPPMQITELFIMDSYTRFFMRLILGATLVVTLLTYSYLKKIQDQREEFYILLLISTLGALVMVASQHFASFFLGLELMSVPLYAMIAYTRTRERSLEAGVKYIILAGASSAFLLFGMSLIYSELGSMQFAVITQKLALIEDFRMLFLLIGLAFMVAGIGFKLSAVPFHMWAPDVYEGAPAPVTAFVATVSKGAIMALLLRYFYSVQGHQYPSILKIFSIMAILSMFLGNILALLQSNVKRLLAYSSMAHVGYMLVAFVVGGFQGSEAILYYLVSYTATTLGAFGIITFLSSEDGVEKENIVDFQGLFWTRPWLAAVFTTVLLSLIGIPLTAGFIGKYFIVAAGVKAGHWALVTILAVNSTLGLYYYLRIVVAMFLKSSKQETQHRARTLNITGSFVLVSLALIIVWLGIYPAPLLQSIRSAVASFLI